MSSPKLQYKKMKIEELLPLAQNDDFKALEEILRREQSGIFATFSYLSNSRENVADLTQEALLRVARNIKSLKKVQNFRGWLNQIVTNIFYDELRKTSRRPHVISMDDEKEEGVAFSIKDVIADKRCKPYEKCIRKEVEEIVKEKIMSLPDNFRVAIVLRELQGLSYEEISEATNSNVGTVKSRISRARLKLQKELKNYI